LKAREAEVSVKRTEMVVQGSSERDGGELDCRGAK
jgi:hypothetical protein